MNTKRNVVVDSQKLSFDTGIPSPDIPVLYQQALSFHQQNRLPEAESLYRKILEHDPMHHGAIHFLGVIAVIQKKYSVALPYLERAIVLSTSNAVYHNNYAIALRELGHYQKARAAFVRATELDSNYDDAHANLGLITMLLHEDDSIAEWHLKKALALNNKHLNAMTNLIELYQNKGWIFEAKYWLEYLISLTSPEITNFLRLAALHGDCGEIKQAQAIYDKVSHFPDGQDIWRYKYLAYCPTVFENENQIENYWQNLNAGLDQAIAENKIYNWQTLVEHGFTHSFNLPHLNRSCRSILEKFSSLFSPSFVHFERPAKRFGNRIRVGFLVTPGHEGGFLRLCTGLIEWLDSEKFEIVLIYNEVTRGQYENHFQRPDLVHVRYPWNFEQAVRTIRNAQCDVIYYWKVGADTWNFFLPMCRLAPIQCTSWATQGTSGVPHIDYYVSWDKAEYSNSQDNYTEKLYLLRTSPLYEPIPQDIPKGVSMRKELGLPDEGALYFCPHQMPKYHPMFDDYLREILRRDPSGYLLILQGRSRELNERLAKRIRLSLGPDLSKRILFIPKQHYPDYYRYLSVATVVLHSPVFSGEITSIDGFLCGVPYVTQMGKLLVQRYSSAFYDHMGIENLAVSDKESYVDQAVKLGTNPEYRHQVSQKILETRDRIFENHQTVQEWERFFTETISNESHLTLPQTRSLENQAVPINNLDINVVYGCNLKCGYCTHFCSWMSGIVSVHELIETFRTWHHKVLPDRLLVVGGEPLLHPELEIILLELHRYWPKARIDLLTNGLLLCKKSNVLSLLKELNGYVYISRHFQDERYLLEFEDALKCLRKSGVSFSIAPSDGDWRKYYRVDMENGHAIPYNSDPEKAWQNCWTKNGCPSLMENKLYKCAHLAYATLGVRKGFLAPQWQVANCYQPLDATCTSREILSLLSTEAVEQCCICPECYEYVPLTIKSGHCELKESVT